MMRSSSPATPSCGGPGARMQLCTFGRRKLMKQIRYTYMDSLIGRLLVAAHDQGLAALRFCEGPRAKAPEPDWNEDPTIARETREELRAYFAGELRHFQSQLHPEGSPFQLAVWAKLCEIRYGATISYGEL